MKLEVTEAAIKWLKEEVGFSAGDTVKFHARYGGTSPVQDEFSLGFTKDQPDLVVSSVMKQGILFFIEENDLWFFDGHDLQVGYDEKLNEINYRYLKK